MRYHIVFLFLAIFTWSCNDPQTGGGSPTPGNENREAESPNIRIQVQNLPAGKAYLIGTYAEQQFRADSTSVDASGNVIFERTEPYPAGYYVVYLPNQTTIQLVIDQDQTVDMNTQVSALIEAMEVSGNLNNELLYRNLKFEQQQNAEFARINQQLSSVSQSDPVYAQLMVKREAMLEERKAHIRSFEEEYPDMLFTKYKVAGQNPETPDLRLPDGRPDIKTRLYLYRTRFWDNVDFADERLIRTPVIINKLNRYFDEVTVQRADSINASVDLLMNKASGHDIYYEFFANWILLHYQASETTIMDPEAVYVNMVQKHLTPEKAFWLEEVEVNALRQRASEMEASLVGKKAPDVVSTGPDGQTHTLYDLKAPYVVVYMYNPECEHCIEQTPKLVNLYRQYKNRGLEVFAIAIDTDETQWKNFIRQNRMGDWINVFDPSNRSIYAKYYVDNTPEIYVLNQEREIIAKNLNVNQIPEVIR